MILEKHLGRFNPVCAKQTRPLDIERAEGNGENQTQPATVDLLGKVKGRRTHVEQEDPVIPVTASGLSTGFNRLGFSTHVGSTMSKARLIAATVGDAALVYQGLAQFPAQHVYSQMYDGGVNGVPPAHLAGYGTLDNHHQIIQLTSSES